MQQCLQNVYQNGNLGNIELKIEKVSKICSHVFKGCHFSVFISKFYKYIRWQQPRQVLKSQFKRTFIECMSNKLI